MDDSLESEPQAKVYACSIIPDHQAKPDQSTGRVQVDVMLLEATLHRFVNELYAVVVILPR